MKKIAIMQPYFLPYIGYWQLLSAVGEFIVYDNIEYTKKGWFNRNRILDGDHDRLFTVPLKKDSDYLDVAERYLADDAKKENARTLRIIQTIYKKAPYYEETYSLIERCFVTDETNLFQYIYSAIRLIAEYLAIDTEITVSSTVSINHGLKAQPKVIALCKASGAETYINAIGGLELYSKNEFSAQGLNLEFIKPNLVPYGQFGSAFVPGLSIIDVLMFNGKEGTRQLLTEYELV